MRIVYNEQLYGIAHYIQCVTVLLIVYNVQNVLRTVDTEHEMLRIVYNAQTVQIEYDIYTPVFLKKTDTEFPESMAIVTLMNASLL